MSSPDNITDDERSNGFVPTTPLPVFTALPPGVGYNYVTDRYIDSAGAEHTTLNEARLATLRHNSQPGTGRPFVLESTPHSETNPLEAMWRAAVAAPSATPADRVRGINIGPSAAAMWRAVAEPAEAAPVGVARVVHPSPLIEAPTAVLCNDGMFRDQYGQRHRTAESAYRASPPTPIRTFPSPLPEERFYFNGNVYPTAAEMHEAMYLYDVQSQAQAQPRQSAAVAPPTPPIVDNETMVATFGPPTQSVEPEWGDPYGYSPELVSRERAAREEHRQRTRRDMLARRAEPLTLNPNNSGRLTITVGVDCLWQLAHQVNSSGADLVNADALSTMVATQLCRCVNGGISPLKQLILQVLQEALPSATPKPVVPRRYERIIHLGEVPEPQPDREEG